MRCMMAKPDLEKYYLEFVNAAIQHGEAKNAKIANKNAAILHRIYKYFQNHRDSGSEFYARLLDYENPSVKTWASAHCLGLNINIVVAEMILEDLSKDKYLGILRLNAELTLENWKKQGYLIL
jgi:hypothetical protein